MSYAALAEQGRQMAQQYGCRPRKSARVKPPAKPKPPPTMTPRYVELCAAIVSELTRLGKAQREDMRIECSEHAFSYACRMMKDKVHYVGRPPMGHWRLK